MRLGLIGTGKQGQRYLEQRNGGDSIVSTYDRHADGLPDWLHYERIDAVIIASHPASHYELAEHCLSYRKPVLVEKPLALNLRQCEKLLDWALRKQTPLEVAHTHLWSDEWRATRLGGPVARAEALLVYDEPQHDYSPWLDWAPHALALLEDTGAASTVLNFERGPQRSLWVRWDERGKDRFYDGSGRFPTPPQRSTPMWNMVNAFKRLAHDRHVGMVSWEQRIAFNRRVYRALFAED